MSKNEKPKIQRVSDNYEKQDAYRRLKGRRTKAINSDFWFEAILIDYAIMEDRLWSLLYYLGILANRDATKVNSKKTKTDIRNIYLGENNQNKNRIRSICKLR